MNQTFKLMQSLAEERRKEQRAKRTKEYRDTVSKASPKYARKVWKKLSARVSDYEQMISQGKKDYSGYHRPGSGK